MLTSCIIIINKNHTKTEKMGWKDNTYYKTYLKCSLKVYSLSICMQLPNTMSRQPLLLVYSW